MADTFRAGVGACIVGSANLVLAFERARVPGSFQLPQGGLRSGEAPVDGLWREVGEETGLSAAHLEVVAEVPEWLGYELPEPMRGPKTGRGQVHKWFVLRPVIPGDPPVEVGEGKGAEFVSWRWMPLAELAEEVVAFRRPVYRRLARFVAGLGTG